MNRIKLIVVTAAFTFFAAPVNAQVGITSVPFLQIEPDSRGAGMGNTGVALADNAAAVFWNPAGLAFQRGSQLSITHSNWLPNFNVDLFYDYVVGKTYIEGIGTIGGHLTYLNLGEQLQTAEDSPEVINRFNSFELAAGLSYGFEISKNFALGTGFRLIYSSLADGFVGGGAGAVGAQEVNPGVSVGLDFGLMYKSNPFSIGARNASLNAGFNLANVGPGIQYTDNAQEDPLPTILRFGWAFTMDLDQEGINTITVANDISKIMARQEAVEVQVGDTTTVEFRAVGPFEALVESWDSFDRSINPTTGETVSLSLMEQFMIGTGLEYWYDKTFAIRTGFYYEDPNNGDRKFVTFGAGLRYDFFGVDFSYIQTIESDHPLAGTLRFSVLFDF